MKSRGLGAMGSMAVRRVMGMSSLMRTSSDAFHLRRPSRSGPGGEGTHEHTTSKWLCEERLVQVSSCS